nr:glucomannan 4-beta-mannosyltransferase 9-like [Tanacetum cinerariifolium]
MKYTKLEKKYKWESIKEDLEMGNSAYPMVLVQIPMYNEKEVYQLSIGAACGLSWPSDRIIIQVLDDSTDPVIKDLVELECKRWAGKGINIKYEIRDNRNGYKAGALKQGMKHSYVKQCEFVAIFDADFQPEPDFLWRTIPFLTHNPELALVQARWKFVNSDECLMTRMQEMSLDYHFTVEQEAGSATHAFFGFNGTAGVWRISALNEAGGWKDRTTVEDMDLAVRVSLKGWKFVYVGDVKVKNELPSTFNAYRYQQHRWSCGPANLFKKMIIEIATNKKVTLWKKLYVIYNFFFVRKIVAHLVTFIFYCVAGTRVNEWVVTKKLGDAVKPKAGAKATKKPRIQIWERSFHLLVFWILFENVMSLHRTKGTFIGLFEAGTRVNEWVVTKKLGDAVKPKAGTAGVWRISALNEAGGWKDRTTVEDMDLAVRVSLKGWKFVYVGDVKVKNELPSTFNAYRYQQHRWSCGPANLFKKMVIEIATNKKVTFWKKLYVIYNFFFVRKIVAHLVTCIFYCVVLPATVLVPEVQVPKWGAIYIPSIVTLLNAVGTPRVNEWVVTKKLGDAVKPKAGAKATKKPRIQIWESVYMLEIVAGLYLFLCGCYDFSFGNNHFYIYLFIQSIAFFIAGFGYIGVLAPNS